jgi:hypothetical protein
MQNKQLILEYFDEQLSSSLWLLDKDTSYAESYYALYTEINQQESISEMATLVLMQKVEALVELYAAKLAAPQSWVTPKKRAANELAHDENGKLTQESIELLQTALVDKNNEKILISDTGKTISFGEKWYQMINSCSFKDVAVHRLTDFISKFIEADGWTKYFVGNIGKNNKRLIQEYHVMDKYNLNHGTSYAAMHLGGDTTKCVLVSVATASSDGKGEPSSITFLEIGAHTIIDRFIVGSFKPSNGKPITEAGPDDLAILLDI